MENITEIKLSDESIPAELKQIVFVVQDLIANYPEEENVTVALEELIGVANHLLESKVDYESPQYKVTHMKNLLSLIGESYEKGTEESMLVDENVQFALYELIGVAITLLKGDIDDGFES